MTYHQIREVIRDICTPVECENESIYRAMVKVEKTLGKNFTTWSKFQYVVTFYFEPDDMRYDIEEEQCWAEYDFFNKKIATSTWHDELYRR